MNRRLTRKGLVQGMIIGLFAFSRQKPQVRAEGKPKRPTTVDGCRRQRGDGIKAETIGYFWGYPQDNYLAAFPLGVSGGWRLDRVTPMAREPGPLPAGPMITYCYDAERLGSLALCQSGLPAGPIITYVYDAEHPPSLAPFQSGPRTTYTYYDGEGGPRLLNDGQPLTGGDEG
jgi:hypothetical protein